MNILHYSLGFPPFRTGGMTKYCIDLMTEQAAIGHHVGMLWPGRITRLGNSISVSGRHYERLPNGELIQSFELVNPMPVPMLDGIKDVEAFTATKDKYTLQAFFENNKIDVFHVHTLMGLPKEILGVLKSLGIKSIFTSHDYFGICPRCFLRKNGTICDDDHGCKDCVECNESALSMMAIRLLQSGLYRKAKDLSLIRRMRKKHNRDWDAKNEAGFKRVGDDLNQEAEKFKKLRSYYTDMLAEFSILHFNSSNTQKIYSRYLDTTKNGKVISITNASVSDNRRIRQYGNTLRIGYLGPALTHKGFYLLLDSLKEIYQHGKTNFELHIYSPFEEDYAFLKKHPPYVYSELGSVMDQFDIMSAPSLCYETFGFTVLEALSYGVPVVVTKYVGSKDLIQDGCNGLIIEPSKLGLMATLEKLLVAPALLKKMNAYIVKNTVITEMSQHARYISGLNYNIVNA